MDRENTRDTNGNKSIFTPDMWYFINVVNKGKKQNKLISSLRMNLFFLESTLNGDTRFSQAIELTFQAP